MARPIPREPPVTSATRPANGRARSAAGLGSAARLMRRALLLGRAAGDDLHTLVGATGRADLMRRLQVAALRAPRQGRRGNVVVAAAVAATHRADLTLR